jgi:type IV pilus assembly protein PilB
MNFLSKPLQPPTGAPAPEPARFDGVLFASDARPFLGTILVRKGWVTPERLDTAVAESKATKRRIGEILLERGWLFENELARALAEQSGLDYVDLVAQGVDPVAAALLPADFAHRYFVVPVRFVGDRILLAAAEPADADVKVLETLLQRSVVLAVAERTAIRGAWRHVFP